MFNYVYKKILLRFRTFHNTQHQHQNTLNLQEAELKGSNLLDFGNTSNRAPYYRTRNSHLSRQPSLLHFSHCLEWYFGPLRVTGWVVSLKEFFVVALCLCEEQCQTWLSKCFIVLKRLLVLHQRLKRCLCRRKDICFLI